MLEIDGSHGEGGGAILRNAVALSAVLKLPVRVFDIRANRPSKGLKAQHLAGVSALAEICDAEVSGLEIGSTSVEFSPGEISGGKFRFDVGTAGSLTLVLQSLLPALAFAKKETVLELVGGTDVAWSPPIDYLSNVLRPLLSQMGFEFEIKLLRRGFYPNGNGKIEARFAPVKNLKPLVLPEQGKLIGISGISVASNLPEHVAERQASEARKVLFASGLEGKISKQVSSADCPGSGVTLWARFSSGAVLGASSLGERGKTAEKVGDEAANELVRELKSNATVDSHACDQVLPFAALAKGESVFSAPEWTSHAETNRWLIAQFIKDLVTISKEKDKVIVEVKGVGD